MPQREQKISLSRKILVVFILFFTFFSYYFYQIFFTPNVNDQITPTYFYIYEGTSFNDVVKDISDNKKIVNDKLSFAFIGKLLNYDEKIKPGKYKIMPEMTNLQLVRMLRNGSQETVRVTFQNLRTKNDIANAFASKLMANRDSFLFQLKNPAFTAKYGFDTFNIVCLFIPNTYDLYWSTNSTKVFDRMKKEYDSFWSAERLEKAKDLNLTPTQVSTLASIVEAEQLKRPEERPKIAGVYLNRYKIGMPLQADPTLVFAHQDFTINRVRKGHKEIDSPYNTYMYAGLPPGPINTPSINSIDAVLNYEKHNYFYFCAIGDGSGLHGFANSFSQHLENARKYQRLLNKANID